MRRNGVACIIGDAEDPHAAAVAEVVRSTGRRPLLFNVAWLETHTYVASPDEVAIADERGELVTLASGRGWIRRLAPPDWRVEAVPGTYDGAVRAAWMTLLVSILATTRVSWLSDMTRVFIAEHKLLQYAVAARLGIEAPRTSVVSEREKIPDELGDPLVVKPLGPGDYIDSAGEGQVVFATELSRSARELNGLAGAPFLLQERLRAERHLRIVTVQDRAWICELEAESLPLDWRTSEPAHDAFRVARHDADLERAATALAREIGVGYSSQDWLIAQGRPVFLDLNPGGQWLFLPQPVADDVTGAIAQWLVGNAREGR